jgi:hypothetical protein
MRRLVLQQRLLLPMIVLGAKDKMGQIIQQVYLAGEDYTIYRTRQGVLVNFADCRVREREQRACYAQISEKLCRLRFLTSQMARWPFGLNRNGGFYDHQIGEAMNLAVQVKKDKTGGTSDLNKATEILNSGLILADEQVTNENRVRYLIACVLVALVPIITLWLLYRSPPFKAFMPYMLAAAAGAAGAVFSIAMRAQDLDLKPFAQSVMNYVMGAVRVLTGFVAGAIILFIVNGTVLGTPPVSGSTGWAASATRPPATSWSRPTAAAQPVRVCGSGRSNCNDLPTRPA